jgi:hypothetical protein
LRRLGDQVVVHPVGVVQEEQRRNLEAAAQRVQDIAGDLPLGMAALRGFGAIDGDVELGIVEGLLDPGIDDAGDVTDFAQDLIRDVAVMVEIRAFDLDVDRGWQAEIEWRAHRIRKRRVR